jgi:predicted secreted hydrolase
VSSCLRPSAGRDLVRRAILPPGIIVSLLLSAAMSSKGPIARAQATVPGTAPLVHFPADQAAHPNTHNEWWYVVGHLRSRSHTFGYEVTLFKFLDVRPPGFSSAVSVYRTDIAITDETSKRFHQKVTYYFPQSATLSASSLNARVGNASLVASGPNDMDLHAAFSKMSITLHLHTSRPPMYVGGRGYINYGTQYTYYYSLTDLKSRGTIKVNGKPIAVSGVSWLDHQWGDWSWTGAKGWTWMALQLGNGIQLSLFDVRAFGTPIMFASVLDKAGNTRTIPGVAISSTGSWLSPHTGAKYPSGWVVKIPTLKATLHVSPTVKDQELIAKNQPQGSYWEGSGRVTGQYGGKVVTGSSYTELTGYAGT